MPRNCQCQGGTCACLLTSSDGSIEINGSGSVANPYDLSAGNISLSGRLQVQDTASINLTLTGAGSIGDPYVLTAETDTALGELTNVDTSDTTVGYVLARQSDGTFALDPPSTAPVGEINTDATIDGDGSAGAPLSVHDWDNFARLAGTDRDPDNMQSLILGSTTSESVVGYEVHRQAPADYDHTSSIGRMRIYNSGTSTGQQLALELIRDGIESGKLLIGPDDELEMLVGSDRLPLPTRYYSTMVEVFGNGNASVGGQVTFPVGRFTTTPLMWGCWNQDSDSFPSIGLHVDFFNSDSNGSSFAVRSGNGAGIIGTYEIAILALEATDQ